VPGTIAITSVAHTDVIETCKRNETLRGAIADLGARVAA
jgi:hypothetical protein